MNLFLQIYTGMCHCCNQRQPLTQQVDQLCFQMTFYRSLSLIFIFEFLLNLNLIERIWKFYKKKVLKNKYYKEFKEFLEATNDFLKNIVFFY